MKSDHTYRLAEFFYAIAAITVFALAQYYAFFGALLPLETEVRESMGWLAVLALDAGVNVFDFSQGIYLYYAHGPADPLFKYLLSKIFFFLEPWQIMRLPLILLPTILALSLRFFWARILVLPWWDALFLSGFFYFSIYAVNSEILLVGRTDGSMYLWLSLACVLAACIRNPRMLRDPLAPKTLVAMFFLGVFLSLAILTNTRAIFFASWPLLGFLWYPGLIRTQTFLALMAGGVTPFLFVLFVFFGGSMSGYLDFFYYPFSGERGWGLFANSVVQYWPHTSWSMGGFGVLFAILAWFTAGNLFRRFGKSSLKLTLAALIILLGYAGLVWLFYLNGTGGGGYYFAPILLVLGFMLAEFSFGDSSKLHPSKTWSLRGLVVASLIVAFDQYSFLYRCEQLTSLIGPSREFFTHIRRLDDLYGVASEDLHFYKKKFRNEKIDNGDLNWAIHVKGNFPEKFHHTMSSYAIDMQSFSPAYVLSAGIHSPPYGHQLRAQYQQVTGGPAGFLLNYVSTGSILYRRNGFKNSAVSDVAGFASRREGTYPAGEGRIIEVEL